MARIARLTGIITLWGLVAVLTGCGRELPPHARQMLRSAADDYQQGRYDQTVRQTNTFLRDFSRHNHAGRAYYLRGKAKWQLGDLSGARADLIEAVDVAQAPDVRFNALMAVGDLAWKQNDFSLAEDMFHQAVEQIEYGYAPSDYARYRYGCLLQRLQRWEEADLQFHYVVEYFGGTDLARRASRRVNARAWCVQAGVFSRRQLANEQVQMLKQRSMPAEVVPRFDNHRPEYFVLVGRYGSIEQAHSILARVRSVVSDAYVTVR